MYSKEIQTESVYIDRKGVKVHVAVELTII